MAKPTPQQRKEIVAYIVAQAKKLGIDPVFALAVALKENDTLDNTRMSSDGLGGRGIFQITGVIQQIAVHRGYDIKNWKDNVAFGLVYLAEKLNVAKNNQQLAYSLFNAGGKANATSNKNASILMSQKVPLASKELGVKLGVSKPPIIKPMQAAELKQPKPKVKKAVPLAKGGYLASDGYKAAGEIESPGGITFVEGGSIISHYGEERDGGARKHEGIDIGAKMGAVIGAFVGGTVTRVNSTDTGKGGLTVKIKGPDGKEYYYAHMKGINVKVGDVVTAGQQIGTVGTSGNAKGTTPHLHFAIFKDGRAFDPEPFVTGGGTAFQNAKADKKIIDPYRYIDEATDNPLDINEAKKGLADAMSRQFKMDRTAAGQLVDDLADSIITRKTGAKETLSFSQFGNPIAQVSALLESGTANQGDALSNDQVTGVGY